MNAIVYLAGALAAINIARKTLDFAARRRHWRVGLWGAVLCIFQRKGGGCLRCKTDFRWAVPHDIPVRAEDGYCVFPLCEQCWQETPKTERLLACSVMLKQWRVDGRYDGPGGDESWDEDRTAIYASVEAGL